MADLTYSSLSAAFHRPRKSLSLLVKPCKALQVGRIDLSEYSDQKSSEYLESSERRPCFHLHSPSSVTAWTSGSSARRDLDMLETSTYSAGTLLDERKSPDGNGRK